MASAAPSSALLNAKLTAENVALRERVRKQDQEIRELRLKNAELMDLVTELRAVQAELKATVERLLASRDARVPKIDPNQGLLFTTAEDQSVTPDSNTEVNESPTTPEGAATPNATEEKPPRKKGDRSRRVNDESNLRREVRRHEVELDQRRCPVTGVDLVEVGTKVSRHLDYRRGEIVVIEDHQVIYGPAPDVARERNIEPLVAPPPVMPVEGVTASASLLALLLYQKYVLHLPLYRQETFFAQLGVRLSRKTLCDWFMKTAFVLEAVAKEIERQVRAGPVLQFDDTPLLCRVELEHAAKSKVKQTHFWVFVNPGVTAVVFRFTKGRSTDDLASILSSPEVPSSVECVVSDGLSTNRAGVRAAGLEVRHGGCWAHVQRKFREALPEARAAMELFMAEVGKIYEIEARAKKDGLDADALQKLRRSQSAVHAVNVLRMTSGWKKKYGLKGKVADALRYARGQRRALLLFLRDGRVPVDNNACERGIRPVAIGRNNWLFAGSTDGARAAATIYTLTESAKASGVDPCAYLEAVLRAVATLPASRVGELTPWAMASELPVYRDRLDAA